MKNESKNIDAYLDEIVKSEPSISLSENFSKDIQKRIVKIVSWEIYWKQFIRFIAGAVLTLLLVIGVLYFVSKEQLIHLYTLVSKHYIHTCFVILITIVIAFYDIVLLNYAFYKYGNHQKRKITKKPSKN